MRLHEYEAKEVFEKYGIPVPEGKVAFSSKEAVEVARKVGLPVVVKAQVLAVSYTHLTLPTILLV